MSLAQARCLRDAARSQKAQGQDPGQIKKQQQAERERQARDNFRRIAEQWLELHATRVTPHTLGNYRRVLEKHILPHLGERGIASITPQDFLAVLQRIEHNPQAVAEALYECAPTIRQNPEGRDWQRYAERTVNYAFTVGGEITIHRNQQAIRAWYALEQRRLHTENGGLRPRL